MSRAAEECKDEAPCREEFPVRARFGGPPTLPSASPALHAFARVARVARVGSPAYRSCCTASSVCSRWSCLTSA
jgi:hypothetical protein